MPLTSPPFIFNASWRSTPEAYNLNFNKSKAKQIYEKNSLWIDFQSMFNLEI